ncbi:MAG: hypothetical protein M0C28_32260 [Candidatus Moduliflexus flocculans]|nr:hypothetical protein [Candidatus Moduliflexus flocculans]
MRRPRFELGLGLTVKVRDALIRLESAGQSAEKTDLGVVPLVNFRLALAARRGAGDCFSTATPWPRRRDGPRTSHSRVWADLSKSLRLESGLPAPRGRRRQRRSLHLRPGQLRLRRPDPELLKSCYLFREPGDEGARPAGVGLEGGVPGVTFLEKRACPRP